MPALQHATTSTVHVDAGTIDLTGEDLVAEFEPEWSLNGLVEADPDDGSARILCGQETGQIAVTAQLWDEAPPLDAERWQDVAEVPVSWSSAFIDFATTGTEVDPSARLDLPGPGDYRIRVHGRNRDGGDPRGASDPVEEYLIQVWRAPAGGPEVWKASSQTAALWRAP
ncbi:MULTISPECIES: hypothetical protein [unclassified Streptomyces]|uniref:hypothetical protein n=1 Tax=unclassified Streptomyces TaxID=2593676 RepID=UPI001BE6893C|nr:MULTISPECIES: hypothetical protein [unclassified Streptomyces]MBT2408628.1 hypothetical protein [Streptomyces sp. ISL-21]MBT2455506.1 hypothetical protein [Streptomyces sp. ISL-86]MBT2608688.1 hypothetical protein [Streptomyces sp. ISL-87]